MLLLILAVLGALSVVSLIGQPVELKDGKSSVRAGLTKHYTPRVPQPPDTLNIDFMLRGYFFACSPGGTRFDGLGGFGKSTNLFRKIDTTVAVSQNEVSVHVERCDTCRFARKFQALRVVVANTTHDTVLFHALDSRLPLGVEAEVKRKPWADIDYWPSSGCGNSYHTLYLPPNTYWELRTPVFKGKMQANMRLLLTYSNKDSASVYNHVTSSIYMGSVNKGQFTEKRPYTPAGLMDPYTD